MRRINRRTGRLSGNWKRHLKKVGRWDYGRWRPTEEKDWPLELIEVKEEEEVK